MLVSPRQHGRCPLGPLATGFFSLDRAVAVPGLRLFPPVPGQAVVVRYSGLPASPKSPPSPGNFLPPGPEYRAGIHHRHRQHRRGSRCHLSGRSGGGVLDVGLRTAGHGHQLCRKTAGRPLSLSLSGRGVAGRPHVLSEGWSPLPHPGRLVRPGLSPCHPGWRRSDPVRFHRFCPALRLGLGSAGGGSLHRLVGRPCPNRRDGEGSPGRPTAGSSHGHPWAAAFSPCSGPGCGCPLLWAPCFTQEPAQSGEFPPSRP